jgi:lysophospholipase L1-like esterase
MTDISALEAYAGELSEAAAKSQAAAQVQHDYVNGDKITDVPTESGPLPTLAKQVVQAQAKVVAALQDAASQLVGATTWDTVAIGLSKTVNGGYFTTPSADTSIYRISYKNVNGVAVYDSTYPSKAAFDAVIFQDIQQNAISPLAASTKGDILVWLEGHTLCAVELSEVLTDHLVKGMTTVGDIWPLATTGASGQIPVWIDKEGLLGAKGLTTELVSSIIAAFPAQPKFAPLVAPAAELVPVSTDGRSLYKWRAKLARALGGDATAKLKLSVKGDSWAEYPTIADAFRTMLSRTIAIGSEGWQSVETGYKSGGATLARSGWTAVDASATINLPYGTGPDGLNVWASTATATMTLGGVKYTEVTIYYRNTLGTFRYRVDGGAWTTVAGTGDNALGRVVLTGLSDTVHTLNIDTAGNAGIVSLYGFYTARSAGGGLEINKCGNAGMQSYGMQNYLGYVQGPVTDWDLDAAVIFLGTNDYRNALAPISLYIATLETLAANLRAATPDIGIIFVAPADTNGVAVTPLASYRDALYQMCLKNGYEFYNMNGTFGPWARASALGQFVDDLHLNAFGAANLATEINHKFLHVRGA